ncbi:putative phosphonate metabolism protein [Faunimonas pinastri]|uniref:Putative phosphonate metabolism protein n=1 Tax=Faunimonas pinastri TaxID=1855383 RepID=A0A1H9L920_9HYPH|nr:DUF1045 domain-containing protein [Faunimonas pinastri]SER07697.1 putative phosphonate metabolism protein [Faunimonas pinastri]
MRVALYYTHAAENPLARAAAHWLGRDAFTGEPVRQSVADGISPERLAELTADPRRYGWHATLKAPFRLAEGRTLPELEQAAADFAAQRGPLPLTLDLQRLGPFFALTPAGDPSAINDFAADVVRAFEPFRAPLTEPEIARRRRSHLSPEQDRYLLDWGYPYVFDLFRLHMTLTGSVPDGEAGATERALRRHFRDFLGKPGQLDALAIFVQPDASRDFLVHSRIPLIAHGAA